MNDTLTKFNWKPQPAAQKVVDDLIAGFLAKNHAAATLAQRMTDDTGTRFKDWIDHIAAPTSPALIKRLTDAGFTHRPVANAPGNYECDLGIFPTIVLHDSPITLIAVKVESVTDFLAAHRVAHFEQIKGEPLSRMRIVTVWEEQATALAVIERHGLRGFTACTSTPEQRVKAVKHYEALKTRRRDFDEDTKGLAEVNRIVDAAIADLGTDWTCDLFFAAERDYWMRRNHAGLAQFARQNRLGLGWANHDHHTYRGSRDNFVALIALWEKLGFRARESFYAGAEAGWGAQVMEQAVTGITTFNDVDMSPEELMQDFAHKGFTEHRPGLGTVGLWCGLHGEAVLQAGMHHLEAQFDWHALVKQLEEHANVRTMAPFTTFPYLRQAFTEGERWSVDSGRIDRLLAKGFITQDQSAQFRTSGAIGSHLENLERNDGFKGFNQQGVSDIIARTDPRKLVKELAGH